MWDVVTFVVKQQNMTLTGAIILLVVVMLFSFIYKVFTGMVNEIIDEDNKLSGNG